MIRIFLLLNLIIFVCFLILKNNEQIVNEPFYYYNECKYEPWGIDKEACITNCLSLKNITTPTNPKSVGVSGELLFIQNCNQKTCEDKCLNCKNPKCLWINRYKDDCSEHKSYSDCTGNLSCIFNRTNNKCEYLKPINEFIDPKQDSQNTLLPKLLKLDEILETTNEGNLKSNELVGLKWEYDDKNNYNDNYMVHYFDNSTGLMSNIQIINNYNKKYIYFYLTFNQQYDLSQQQFIDHESYYLDKNKVYIFYVYAINSYGIGPPSNRIVIKT